MVIRSCMSRLRRPKSKCLSFLKLLSILAMPSSLIAEEANTELAADSLNIDVLLQNNELLDSLILGDANVVDELIRQAADNDDDDKDMSDSETLDESAIVSPEDASGISGGVKQDERASIADDDGPLSKDPEIWDVDLSLFAGLGYKENVLYNAFDAQDSPFSQLSFDVTFMRLSRPHDWRFFSFLLAENAHYFDVDGLDDEWLVLLMSRGEKRLGENWDFGLESRYTYLEQAFDIAFEEADLGTQNIELHQFQIVPKIEYEWRPDNYLRLEVPVEWNLYRDRSDNYDEFGIEAAIGREYRFGSRFELAYFYGIRDYTDRGYRDSTGSRVEGTDLEWREQQVNVIWDHRFDKAKRYRSRTKLRLRRVEDNGTGYDDFWMFRASQRLSVAWNDWTFSGDVSYTYYDYDSQTVSSVDLDPRYRSLLSWSAGIERSLGDSWELALDYRFEDYLSNLPEDEYDVHTFSFGITRKF